MHVVGAQHQSELTVCRGENRVQKVLCIHLTWFKKKKHVIIKWNLEVEFFPEEKVSGFHKWEGLSPPMWGLISGPDHTVAVTALPQRAILSSNKGTFTWTLRIPAQPTPQRADTDTVGSCTALHCTARRSAENCSTNLVFHIFFCQQLNYLTFSGEACLHFWKSTTAFCCFCSWVRSAAAKLGRLGVARFITSLFICCASSITFHHIH